MDTPRRGSCRAEVLVLIAGLVFVLSACGAGASGTRGPTATAAPTATRVASPSPTPDVAALFVAKLKAMTAGRMTMTAELVIGGVAATVDGRYDVNGQDSYETTTVSVGQQKMTNEETTVLGKAYKRAGDAPWYEQKAAGTGGSAVTKAIMAATDTGVVTWEGQRLHKLAPSGTTLGPKDFGFDDGTATLALFAKDDGTPVAVEVRLDATQGTGAALKTVTGTMTYTFVPGVTPKIDKPDPIFVTYASPTGYSVGHPQGWDERPEKDWTYLEGPNDEELGVYAAAKGSETVTSATAAYVYMLKTDFKATILSNAAGSLAGETGRVVTYTFKDDAGMEYAGSAFVVIHGSTLVVADWISPPAGDTTESETRQYVLASFAFTK